LAEPHYCETYAALVCKLKGAMPEFPNPDGGKPVSFKSTLLNVCQEEFEGISRDSLELNEAEKEDKDKEELEFLKAKKKARCLANIKFIGELFLTKLLTAAIVRQVLQDLVMCNDASVNPPEHVLECICTLLTHIGYTLDSSPVGQQCIKQICGRLLDLKQRKSKKNKEHYSKRVQFMIQDLIDTKNAGWTRKVFKLAAKTKEEIGQDAKRDEKTKGNDGSQLVVAGQRPAWMSATSGSAGASAADDGPWQDVPMKSRR